jgi:UV DNA damage endonuclease
VQFGYASQNLTLGVTTGHTLRLSNVPDAARLQAVIESNLDALHAILCWNAERGIGLFRMSQQLIPFASHPSFPYDWEAEHGPCLRELGILAGVLGIRLSMHPGQFIQPGSPNPDVAERSIAELRYVARLLSLLRASDCVLHLGGVHGDRSSAASRFVAALEREEEILRFLVLENDERLWSVGDVLPPAERLGVPVVVDTLHHALNPGRLGLSEALDAALPTWNRHPKVHLSSQDPAKQPGAHAWDVTEADYASLRSALGHRQVDVMVEAKGKEMAVLPLLRLAATEGAETVGVRRP